MCIRDRSDITLVPGKEHIMLMGKSMPYKIKGIKCDLILESVNSVQTFNRVPVFFEVRE